MVSSHSDDHWEAPASGSPDAIIETIDDAAVWIRQRLKSGGGSSRKLNLLCLDTDGAICTWTKPEDTSPEMITAAIEQLDADHDEDALEGSFHSSMGERFPNLPLEVHFEPLNAENTSEGSRRAVVATPDVPARLLIDELDSMGTRIGSVETIWSLIARCWDPGSEHNSGAKASSRVVTTDDPVCGSVIMDVKRARLIWTWSKQGELIAAGSMRVGFGQDGPMISPSDISRLCNDWIGWATQLGVAPMRVVMVLPEQLEGLDRAQIHSEISKHWPMATTDLIAEDEPLLATLRKANDLLAEKAFEQSHEGELTNRPGRAHRSMYRWASLALIIAGAAVSWTAWQLYNQGSETQQLAKASRSSMVEQIMKLQPPIQDLRLPETELQARLNRLRAKSGPVQVAPNKPILEELETISFVLGMTGIEIESIQLTHTLVKLQIRTEELSLAEQINEALRSIEGSNIQWRASPDFTRRGELIEASFSGVWNTGSSS